MTFKFIIFCGLLVATVCAHVTPITYTTAPVVKFVNPSVDDFAAAHENVVHTPYASASKMDTRINNNFYTPVLSKTLAYAAPAVAKTVAYAAPAIHQTESYAAPAVHKTVAYAAPAVHKTVSYAAPAVAKTVSYATPSVTYAASSPLYEKTLVTYPKPKYAAHVPVLHSYTAPVVKQSVAYSPATSVSHVSFEGFGSHWGY